MRTEFNNTFTNVGQRKIGTELKVLRNYLMLFPTPSLSHRLSDPFRPQDRRAQISGYGKEGKRKSIPSQNKSVKGKRRSCLPGAMISSLHILRKTARVGVGTKSSTKTKTKVAPKPPNKQPSTPALPPSSHANQAGPPSGLGLHEGANTARSQPNL